MKLITQFQSLYSITDSGDIYSHVSNKYLKQKDHPNGYKEILVVIKQKKFVKYIHRLVAEYFIGDVSDKQINHIDGDKTNNNYRNLEIVTARENQRHAIENGLFREMNRDEKGRLI